MKRHTVGVVTAICTFIVGIAAAWVWVERPSLVLDIPPVNSSFPIPQPLSKPDSNIYSVTFDDLIRNSKTYDKKLIRTRAIYQPDTDTTALFSPGRGAWTNDWIRPTCVASVDTCNKIGYLLSHAPRVSNAWYEVELDMIGRYYDDVVDPDPNQNGFHVHFFEILAINGSKYVKARR